MITPRRQSLILSLFDALRAHLIKSRFSEKAYGTEVSPTGAFILDRLNSNPDERITSLALALNLNKSTVSRCIGNLLKSGYLKETAAIDEDRRGKNFALTKKGDKFIELQNKINHDQITAQASNLNAKEKLRFIKLFKALSDGAGAPELPIQNDDFYNHALIQMRRLTLAHSATSDDFHGTGHTALDWVILSEIHYGQQTLTELAESLQMPVSTLDQKLKGKKFKDLLKRKKSDADLRVLLLSLSSKGEAELQKIESAALKRFDADLRQMSNEDLTEFVSLLKQYCSDKTPCRSKWLDDETEIKKVSSEHELKPLRAFLVKEMNEVGMESYPISPSLLNPEHLNLVILRNSRTIGIAEILIGEKSATFLNFACQDRSLVINKRDFSRIFENWIPQSLKLNQDNLEGFLKS